MNAADLEFFVRVARLGSISRAAIELGIEQSTMTRHVARLEADVGARLFHRSGRGVVPTHAGGLLLQEAACVVDALERARRAAAQLGAQGPAQLVIAAQPTLAQRGFAPLARAMRQRFPQTRLRLLEALGHQVVGWLAQGEVDAALLYVPSEPGMAEFDVLMHEPLYLVGAGSPAGDGAALEGRDDPARGLDHGPGERTIDAAQALGRPLILPSTVHGLRALAESLAQRCGARLDVGIESDGSTAVTRRLVAAGLGCTLLPLAAVAEDVARGTLQAARIVAPEVRRAIALATARNRPPLTAHWEVMQVIRQAIAREVLSGRWPGVREMAPASGAAPSSPGAGTAGRARPCGEC